MLFGLGLVGGSVARAARAAWPGMRIVGVDRDAIAEVARERGFVDEAVGPDRAARALADAELVVLCLPILQILAVLERHASDLGRAVVTDTGSTKREIVAVARRCRIPRFVGGHPMAGKAQGGLAHSDAGLFEDARWLLCSEEDTDPSALSVLRDFVGGLGARPVEVSAADHDRDVALTSHVPHIVVNALAESVLSQGALDAAGGSLRDVLQVAGAPFDVWGDTLSTNAVAIRVALEELIARLQGISSSLEDKDRMRDLFARGHAVRERVAEGKEGKKA